MKENLQNKETPAVTNPLVEVVAKPVSPDLKRFQAYVETGAFTRRLREAAISNGAYLGRDCDSAYRTRLLSVLHQPEPTIAMPEDAVHPVIEIWRTGYQLERCCEALIRNTIFAGKAKGPANMWISMPRNMAAGSRLAREIRADIKDTALDHRRVRPVGRYRVAS
jgi:hypothetical protein